MYCKFCGSSIDGDCSVCPYCGKRLVENSQNNKSENEFDNFYDNKQETFHNENNNFQSQNTNSQSPNMAQNNFAEKPADSIFMLIGLFLVSFFTQPLGIIFAIIWKDEYPKRSKVCLAAFLIPIALIIISIILVLLILAGLAIFG